MVPLLIGGATIRLIGDIWKADDYNREARHVNYEAFTMVEAASRKFQSQREKLDETLTKLANRKRAVMSSSLPKFVGVYERIKRIDFDEMHALDDENALALRPENLSAINQMISVSGVQMSTEQTLGTFLFSWEYGGIGGAIKKEARINLDVAQTRSDEAEVIAHNIDTARIAVEGINDKAEAVLKLLTQMNALFLKSLQYTSGIIAQRGLDKRNYGVDDKKALMNCMNFAKAVADVLKAPLFDANGKLSRQVDETLSAGNEYVKKIQVAAR